MKTQRRTINAEVRIIDSSRGVVDYVASDETLDSYQEVIRADGWRFNNFKKNAPFVDSHDYRSLDRLLGKVLEFRVADRKLIERVQWAKDIPENQLAQLGWRMTEAGYLKAVSVGFWPTRWVSKYDSDRGPWLEQLEAIGTHEESGIRRIFIEQEQVELSAVIIGANPNALAKSYKDGLATDSDMELVSRLFSERLPESAPDAGSPDDASEARHREQEAFLRQVTETIRSL